MKILQARPFPRVWSTPQISNRIAGLANTVMGRRSRSSGAVNGTAPMPEGVQFTRREAGWPLTVGHAGFSRHFVYPSAVVSTTSPTYLNRAASP